jgi:hypothetical protein
MGFIPFIVSLIAVVISLGLIGYNASTDIPAVSSETKLSEIATIRLIMQGSAGLLLIVAIIAIVINGVGRKSTR